MATALIIYATRAGQTRRIAQEIAEGLKAEGVTTTVMGVAEIPLKKVEPGSFDALVLGSATYHGEMLESMKSFLFTLEDAGLNGKAAGAFGAYGWSGEAPGRIFATLKNVFGMETVAGPLRVRSVANKADIAAAREYGVQIAKLAKASA